MYIYIYIAHEFPVPLNLQSLFHSPSHTKPARTVCSARRSNNSGSTWRVLRKPGFVEITRSNRHRCYGLLFMCIYIYVHICDYMCICICLWKTPWKSQDIVSVVAHSSDNQKNHGRSRYFPPTNETCVPYQKSIQTMKKVENWWVGPWHSNIFHSKNMFETNIKKKHRSTKGVTL